MEDSLPSSSIQNPDHQVPSTLELHRTFIFDSDFCGIYFKVGKELLQTGPGLKPETLYQYFEEFKKCFNKFYGFRAKPGHPEHDSEKVKYLKESPYYRIIYVLGLSPILSSAVVFHFQNVLKENLSYLENLMTNEKIKICSIGGGAASDVVAVVKILDLLAKEKKKLNFEITIIDSDANWKNTCSTVLSFLKKFYNATLEMNFIQADILDKNSYSKEVTEAIQEADVVLMVFLLYDFINAVLDAKDVVKNTCEMMKFGSMLFVLDLDLVDYIKWIFGLSGETENFHVVYENLSDFHLMKIEAENEAWLKYKNKFKYNGCFLKCCSWLPVFVRAWIKTQTKEISSTREELQHRFKEDILRFDQGHAFLGQVFFDSWLRDYAARKKKSGYSEKDTEKLLGKKKRNKGKFLTKLEENKENLEKARKEIVGENLKDGKDPDDIVKEAWEEFINQKKEYSHVKYYAYKNLFFDKEIPEDSGIKIE